MRQLLPALQADQATKLVQADDAVLHRLRNQVADLMVAHSAFRALKAHHGHRETTVIADPVIVLEVLSPSTAATDRAVKLRAYFRLPSVQHYLIVATDQRRVVHHRRAGEGIATSVHIAGWIELAPPGLGLDVDALYAEAGAP